MEKKYPQKSRKIHGTNVPVKQKLRYLKVLEQCDMNFSEAPSDRNNKTNTDNLQKGALGQYLAMKEEVQNEVLSIEATKKSIAEDIERITGEMDMTMKIAVEKIRQRIIDDEFYLDKQGFKHYVVETRDIVSLVNVLAPYLADKRGVKGIDEKTDPKDVRAIFLQNITNIMNSRPAERQKAIEQLNIEEGKADEID